jgi:hypothetical protein
VDEDASALAGVDAPLSFQDGQRRPDGRAGDGELDHQLTLGRQGFSWRGVTAQDAFAQPVSDLPVGRLWVGWIDASQLVTSTCQANAVRQRSPPGRLARERVLSGRLCGPGIRVARTLELRDLLIVRRLERR